MSRLSVSITHADGRVTRWGDDEPLAERILQDLTFSTSIPGGFKNCTGTLLRLITRDYPDLNLFDTIRIYGPGNQTAFEGRMVQFPRSHGDSFSISPSAVGWAAHLLDDPTFSEIYISRDITNWRLPGLERQLSMASNSQSLGDTVATVSTSGSPSLMLICNGAWGTASGIRAEAYYDAPPGGVLERVAFDWFTNSNIGTDPNFLLQAYSTADEASFPEASADVLTGAVSGTLSFSAATARKELLIQLAFPIAAGVAGTAYAVSLANARVFGNHGLTVRGATSATEGFYASDVLADIVSRTAPLLTYTTGASGSIEPTTFVIPHLIFTDPTTGSDAISFVNAYHQYDWGVYDNKQFFFRAADPDTLTWEARLSEGARVDLEGDTADQLYNGVYVTYTDAAGAQKTVGPPGAAADATDSALGDTSTDNPVNAAGIPRRWAILNVSQPTNLSGATQIGFVWLAEHSLPQRRGTLTLTGTVTHPTEGKVPVWRVRAGDFIRISDHPADVPRRIIETSYTHANGGVLSATLDNTVFKLESIIERALGVQMVGII